MNNNVFFLSFFFFKYLLCLHISFLKYLLLTVLGLRCWAQAFSSCCQQGLLSSCGAGLLNVAASLLVMHGLGYSQARSSQPCDPTQCCFHCKVDSQTTGPPRKPPFKGS